MVPESNLLAAQGRRRIAIDFAIGAAIGIAVFLLLYSPGTLNVTYDSWIYNGYVEEDIIQRYAGWLYYRAAPWSWPLTVAENVSVPYGASIAFTDSIPLAAVFCKLLSPLLPATFQYFGWYNLLNFALQGGFAMLLLGRFGLQRGYSAAASLLFVGMPVFVERVFRHDGLASQWMILAALLFYFTARHSQKFPLAGFFLLTALAPAIHTYFLPMVYALLAAALIEHMIKYRKILRPLLWLVGCFAGTIAVGYAMGILTRGGDGGASGYGLYSMNLNALFNPTSFDWYAQDLSLNWSTLLPVRPQFYRQYEGFNYLGAGVLLALLALAGYGLFVAVRAVARKDKAPLKQTASFLKSHLWLLVVCLCLTVFSISHVVCWDDVELLVIPLPDMVQRLSAIFRASGRLFWLCTYLLTLLPVVFFGRRLQGRWKALALAAVLAVQLFDLSGVLQKKHQYFASGPIAVSNEFTSDGWRFLAENYDEALCLGNLFDYNLAAGLIRYNPNMVSNIIITNRGSFPVIEASYGELQRQLREGEPLQDGVLYLCGNEETFRDILEGLHPDARGYKMGRFYVFANPLPACPLQEYLPGK